LILYFVTANALLKHFDYANIQHVPRVENQEANDLAQIASSYRVSKVKFEELIEIKEKLVSTDISLDELSTAKLGGQKSRTNLRKVKVMLKFLPLIIYQIMIGENQLLNTCRLLQGLLVEKPSIEL